MATELDKALNFLLNRKPEEMTSKHGIKSYRPEAYKGLEPQDFTLIHDDDLKKQLAILRECYSHLSYDADAATKRNSLRDKLSMVLAESLSWTTAKH